MFARRRTLILPMLLAASLALPVACSETKADPQEEAAAELDAWGRVKELYEEAKESGEKVPGDVAEWARDEVRKVGAFEYRVVEVPGAGAEAIEARLNELGHERWECFEVEPDGPVRRLYCKRPVRSYLRALPLRELVRLVPLGDSGD